MTKLQLTNSVWKAADVLRGSIEPHEYKEYLLPLIFYKYLSDKQLMCLLQIIGKPTDTLFSVQKSFEVVCRDNDTGHIILKKIHEKIGYSIRPEFTFMAHIQSIEHGTFQTKDLEESLQNIQNSNNIFKDMFEDMDLRSKRFGHTANSNNKIFSEVLQALSSVENMLDYTQKELGDAFEKLIADIASASGNKSGEFYTSHSVNKLLAQIAMHGKQSQSDLCIYDPTMGSGSLLLSTQKHYQDPYSINFYGQEINNSSYNLARMNMFFHGVPLENQNLKRGDTLGLDWPNEGQTKFDAVLMNPPYSARWLAEEGYLSDPRFEKFGVLAPKSKADYSFLLHGYHHLNDAGTMVILLPHGVLFRGGSEGKIRQTLLEMNAIDSIIGLPSNLLYGTGIQTAVIVLKKNRSRNDVLFIDASQEFEKDRSHNILTDSSIESILKTYKERKNKNKYSHVATFEEIIGNDYNLNIPRYVDTFEEEEISLDSLSVNINYTQQAIQMVEEELTTTLQNLLEIDGQDEKRLENFIQQYMQSQKE